MWQYNESWKICAKNEEHKGNIVRKEEQEDKYHQCDNGCRKCVNLSPPSIIHLVKHFTYPNKCFSRS